MIAELAALALACAPNIHPITLHALISHESRARQYAIGVNRKGKHLRQQPRTLTEATEAAQGLIDQGIDFDAGLGQINVRNWAWLNLDTKTVFDPCRNLAAAQTVLAECYARSLSRHKAPQQALRAALSCYNTGNFTRGFTNGYVGKVLAKADIKVPALTPLKESASHPTRDSKSSKPKSTQNPDQEQPAQVQGTPDGFIANPSTDGFAQSHDSGPAPGSTENDQSNWFPSRHLGEPATKALPAPALESILGHTTQGASQGLTEETMPQQSQQQPSDHSAGRNQVSQPSDQALLYRIHTAEAKLGVSRSTIYRLVKEGQLVLIKIGKRSSGITAASVHALIERNKALSY